MQYKANKLKELRILNKYSQAEVGKALFISQTAYSPIELGKRKADFDKLELLASLYKVHVSDLIEPSNADVIFNTQQKDIATTSVDYKNATPKVIITHLQKQIAIKNELLNQKELHISKLLALIDSAVKL